MYTQPPKSRLVTYRCPDFSFGYQDRIYYSGDNFFSSSCATEQVHLPDRVAEKYRDSPLGKLHRA